ncbi:hypothetical protein CXF68_09130 [Tenacibaculum sp. Bg11-29]|nr:hypothetical protein CXF68_09130 [Tenacibaculum sp. Bg11-29]
MITKEDLYNLNYTEKPENINMHNGSSTDYRHQDFNVNRPYLVNLKNGYITTTFPLNKPKQGINTDDLKAFIKCHNNICNQN